MCVCVCRPDRYAQDVLLGHVAACGLDERSELSTRLSCAAEVGKVAHRRRAGEQRSEKRAESDGEKERTETESALRGAGGHEREQRDLYADCVVSFVCVCVSVCRVRVCV